MKPPFLPLVVIVALSLGLFLWQGWPIQLWFMYISIVVLGSLVIVRSRARKQQATILEQRQGTRLRSRRR